MAAACVPSSASLRR